MSDTNFSCAQTDDRHVVADPAKLLSAARGYLQCGLSTLPAKRSVKRPTVSWRPYQHQLPTYGIFCVRSGYDAICIITGKVSGNLLMIDFDQQANAYPQWAASVPAELLARCVIEKSQRGGKHVVVRSECEVGKNTKLALDSEGKVLIETRGEGGLFLCAPTEGYEILQGAFGNIPILTASEVETLLEAARALNEAPPKPETKPEAKTATTPFVTYAVGSLDETVAKSRAASYAAHMDASISGQGGHNALFRFMSAMLWDYGLSPQQARPIIDAYNARAVPAWSDQELEHKISAALNPAKHTTPRGWRDAEYPKASKTKTKKNDIAVTIPHQPFPVDVFLPVLRDMIGEVSRFANVDPSVPAIALLPIVASVIGSTHRITYGDASQPSILWGAIVIPSGEGKSEALSTLTAPLDRIDKLWAKQNAATRGKNPTPFDEPLPTKPKQKRLVVRSTTVEGLCGILSDNPDGICINKDELGEWFGEMNAYSTARGKDEAFWNASYNGESYSVDRKTATSYRIENTTISIVGGIQPRVLQRILKRGAELTDSGLTLRPLYTMSPVLTHVAGRRTIDAGIRARYELLVDELLKLREPAETIPFADVTSSDDFSPPEPVDESERAPVDIPLDADVEIVYDAFVTANGAEHARLPESPLKSYLARMRGTLLRLALVLHVASQVGDNKCVAAEVSAATMGAAVRIAEWCKHEFRRVFTAFGLQPDRADETDADTEAILRVIAAHDGGATVRDIQRSASHHFAGDGGADRIERKLAEMRRAGRVDIETKTTDGRAATYYRRTSPPTRVA